MKKSYAKAGWLGAFLLLSASAHGQIKVEAEDFIDAKSLSSKIITENDGKSIGYFDEEGEQLTYEVEIPSDGLYQVSFHYLTGKDGNVKILDAEGNYSLFDIQANNAEKWWEVPMNNWPDFPKEESALFPLKAGKQTFSVICTGKSVNLDYFTFTKSSSTDANVTKITTSPSKLNLIPSETVDIVAKGFNNAGELIAANTKWSTNAPNGRYKASANEGSDVVTITMGETVKELKAKIAMPTKRQDFVVTKNGKLNTKDGAVRNEKGEKVCLMGPSWYWSCSAPQWWKGETVDYLVENWNIQVIRLPVSIAPCKEGQTPWTDKSQTWNTDNYLHSPEYTKALVDEMVRAAIENDIYVIIDFHEHNAQHWTDLSIEFFEYFATKWGKYPNVMYEIFNEPTCSDGEVVTYAKQVIPAIRKIDDDNIIIVGSSEWSRHPDAVTSAGDGYSNIAYTWHGYIEWGHQSDWNGKSSWNNGVPVVVTEWGMDPDNTGGLLDVYKQRSVISAFWSMSNKGGNDAKWSVLKDNCFKTTGWTESDMTVDGKFMLDQCKGWINYKPVITTPVVKALSMNICSAKKFFLPTDETTLTGDAAGGSENYQFAWKQVSGPSDAAIANANSATTKVSGLEAGEYVFKLTVSDGEDEVSESVKVTVLPEGYVDPGLIDDMEDNDVITKWGGSWTSKDDSDKNGNPSTKITASDNLVKDGVVKADYTMGAQWPGNGWMGDPYCTVDMYLRKNKEGEDLSSCEKITYRFKGSAHEFRVCMTAVTDDDYHTKKVSASSDWQEVSVSWSSLKQASDWGDDMDFDLSSISKLSWQIKDKVGATGTLYIDDVTCVGGHSAVENVAEDEDSFVIAPNPAKNGVANIYVAEKCDVTVTDMTGRVVAKFVAVPEFDNKISISNTGMYVVKAGNSVKKLIVK